MTTLRADYEEQVLDELQDIPEAELPKFLKLVHFLKTEIFDVEKQDAEDLRLFWESFGGWQDHRTAEEIIADIYASRTSTERELQL
jgi:hypothetical protein